MFFRRTPPIPGKNSIAQFETVQIGGIPQTLLIRGQNQSNPILLLLHGGPGTAQIGLARRYVQALERDFVVVNWDQRGAGLSYSAQVPVESMTIEQFIQDARELAEYLLKRFGQKKLFVVGHSWGTVLGTLVVSRYPHLFHAYVGMGQVVCMEENEAVSYQFTLDEAQRRNHAKALRDLQRIGAPPYPGTAEVGVQRRWLNTFGGSMHTGSLPGFILSNLFLSTEYSVADFIRMLKGNSFSLKHLWPELMAVNLRTLAPRLEVPVYFVLGRYDYQTPHTLAADYFEKLQAPSKELIWFEQSAHMLVFEEPERFVSVMRGVLENHRRAAAMAG